MKRMNTTSPRDCTASYFIINFFTAGSGFPNLDSPHGEKPSPLRRCASCLCVAHMFKIRRPSAAVAFYEPSAILATSHSRRKETAFAKEKTGNLTRAQARGRMWPVWTFYGCNSMPCRTPAFAFAVRCADDITKHTFRGHLSFQNNQTVFCLN